MFCIPGMCVAESQFSFSCSHFQICLDKVSNFSELLVPNLSVQATSVEFKPNSIALSYNTLM